MVIPAQTEGLSHLWTRFLPTEEQIETFFYLGIAFTAFISSLRDSQKDLRMYIILIGLWQSSTSEPVHISYLTQPLRKPCELGWLQKYFLWYKEMGFCDCYLFCSGQTWIAGAVLLPSRYPSLKISITMSSALKN